MRRTHPALAVVGIFFHGGMMFLLPLIVGLVASMLLDVSEVAETSLGLAIGAAVVGVGVGAWAAWDWLADEPATSGKSSASWIVMPASDGGVRWTLHLHY